MTANSVLFRLLLTTVLWAPLPLGSNRPWSWSLLAVIVGALLTVWACLVFAGRIRVALSGRWLWIAAAAFIATLGWAWAQTLDGVLTAHHHPMWEEAALALGGTGISGTVSVDPALTRQGVLKLALYGGVFFLCVQLCRERERARQAIIAFSVFSVLYAAYGLIIHFSGQEMILWLPKWAYIGDLTATFVNRNAYGAYAGLGVVCLIGLFIHELRPSRGGRERRSGEVAEALILRGVPYMLGAVVCGSALLLSHSRGAFLATGAALVCLTLTTALIGVVRMRMAALLAVAISLVGFLIVGVNGEGTLERLATETSRAHEKDRANVYRLTLEAVSDAPIAGNGLGTFLPAFRVYQDISLPGDRVWDYAHNVYLELAMDLGLPAAAIFGLCFVVCAGVCVRGLLRRRRDQIYPAIALAAMLLSGLHGLVDFSPQTPAIAVTLALLLGVGCAQSWNTADRTPERGSLRDAHGDGAVGSAL